MLIRAVGEVESQEKLIIGSGMAVFAPAAEHEVIISESLGGHDAKLNRESEGPLCPPHRSLGQGV